MKTAISIPDQLYKQAEAYAKRHALSRSELYVRALAEHLRRQAESRTTASFNDAYDEAGSNETDAWGDLRAFRRTAKRRRGGK